MAGETGWSEKVIRTLIGERRIQYLKRGNRYLIPRGAIDEFIERSMVEPSASSDA
jgi:excisionase family DNA binding protein